jgi:hypothetical protein
LKNGALLTVYGPGDDREPHPDRRAGDHFADGHRPLVGGICRITFSQFIWMSRVGELTFWSTLRIDPLNVALRL